MSDTSDLTKKAKFLQSLNMQNISQEIFLKDSRVGSDDNIPNPTSEDILKRIKKYFNTLKV